jgi:hypothetical protein
MTGLALCQTCDGTGRLYIQSKWHICGPCGGTGARIPGDPRGREITPANSSSFGRSQVKASTPPVRLRGIHDGHLCSGGVVRHAQMTGNWYGAYSVTKRIAQAAGGGFRKPVSSPARCASFRNSVGSTRQSLPGRIGALAPYVSVSSHKLDRGLCGSQSLF